MSEPVKTIPAKNAGANPPTLVNAPVAAKPVASDAAPVVVTPARDSVPLFGGHRGGGKKRKDGLVAGSPEAIEADKKSNAARMRLKRLSERQASLPAPLPSAPAKDENPSVPLATGATALPVAVAGVAVPAAAPLFVAWSQGLLLKPAKLLTKITDRLRCWSLMKRVRKLELTPTQEKEIAADLQWKDATTADFSVALAECATVELNKRSIGGGQHAHWINLAMTSGEMLMAHVSSLEKLEKMIAENAAKKLMEQARESQSKPGSGKFHG